MVSPPPDMVQAIRERERRHERWMMIHHICGWKAHGYCVRAWDERRAIVPCSVGNCPILDRDDAYKAAKEETP